MAYYQTPSNYYGYGYYPVVQQPIMYPQSEIPYSQPMNMQTNNSFAWVQGEAGAKSYPVARGTTVPLFDSEGDYVYFKSVDNNGVPLPLVTKMLCDPPVEVKAEVIKEEVVQPQIDLSNYVTKEKYEEIKNKYTDLEFRILELETKPNISSTFTGNTFNNTRKDGNDNGTKLSI